MSLDFGFTPEQELLRGVVRSFAARELTPEFLRELDASGRAHRGVSARRRMSTA